MTRTNVILCSLAALLAAVAALWSVSAIADQDKDDWPTNRWGVYLPESSEAADLMRRARRLAASRLWDQAAQVLQQVGAKYADRVIPVPDRDDLAIGIGEAVNGELADWPSAGLAAYRRLFDPEARQAYEQASASADVACIASVARQYWHSSIGAQAADEAAERSFEAGQFATAADLWGRLADRFGNEKRPGELAATLAKLAVALRALGQTGQAEAVRDRLVREFGTVAAPPAAEGAGARSARTLAQWVQGAWDSLSPPAPAPADDYPILGGGASRNAVADRDLVCGPELWHYPPESPPGATGREAAPAFTGDGPDFARGSERVYSPVRLMAIPVIGGAAAYLYTPAGVQAIRISDGKLLWLNAEYRARAEPVRTYGGAYSESRLVSPTYADGRLYLDYDKNAGRARVLLLGAERGYSREPAGLVCLDARTGQEIWNQDLTALAGLKGGQIDSSPLVMDGRVLAVVRVQDSITFDVCALLAADARTGQVLWQRQLTTGRAANVSYYQTARTPMSLAAGEGNTVYLATNLGTVASVAADTGEIRWIRRYDRDRAFVPEEERPIGLIWRTRVPPPPSKFMYAPTMVHRGQVIVLPSDGNALLVLDGRTGELVRSADRRSDLYDATEVFGVVDGKLYARGNQVVCWDLAAGKRDWAISLDADPTYRGCLTRKYLYVPTRDRLLRLDLAAEGKTESFSWPDNADGALVLTSQQIITVNPTRVAGFMQWEHAQRLDLAAIAAQPGQTDPIITYAQHAYATGHLALAKEQLKRAADAGGGLASLTDEELRRRLFENAMAFAGGARDKDLRVALELLDLASLLAPDVQSQVRYRVALAEYWKGRNEWAKAVRYYQEILRCYQEVLFDGQTPDASFPPAALELVRKAGWSAREQIDLIRQAANDAYDAVAAQADQDYDQAHARDDWPAVERLTVLYPNAGRTIAELFGLAERDASRSDYSSAVDRLNDLRREYGKRLSTPEHHEDDLRCIRQLASWLIAQSEQVERGNDLDQRAQRNRANRLLRSALLAVRRGVSRYPDVRVSLQGVEATFREHQGRMERACPALRQGAPLVGAPLRVGPDIQLNAECRLLAPLLGPAKKCCPNDDIILVAVADPDSGKWELRGYRAAGPPADRPGAGRAAQLLWTTDKFDSAGKPALVCCHDDWAIIALRDRVFAIDPETGRMAWPLPFQAPQPEPLLLFARHENKLFAGVAGRPIGFVIDLATGLGRPLALPSPLNSQPFINERLIGYVTQVAGRGQLVLLDPHSGLPKGDFAAVSQFVSNPISCASDPEGKVVVLAGYQSMAAIDPDDGKQPLWRRDTQGVSINPVNGLLVQSDAVFTAEKLGGVVHLFKWDLHHKGKQLLDTPIPPLSRPADRDGTQARLTVEEDGLYVWSNSLLACVNPADGDVSWQGMLVEDDNLVDVLVSQNYVVALCQRPAAILPDGRQRPAQVCVRMYERAEGGGRLIPGPLFGVDAPVPGLPFVMPASPGLAVQAEPGVIRLLMPAAPPAPKR